MNQSALVIVFTCVSFSIHKTRCFIIF